MKNLYYRFSIEKNWIWATPHIGFAYSKQTPFADWDFHLRIIFFRWSFNFELDNTYKYYPKYKKDEK